MVDIVLPDKGCEVLDGDLTPEYWNENDSENFADSGDSYILVQLRGHCKIL